MRRFNAVAVVTTVLAVLLGGTALAPSASANRYTPKAGIITNNPLGPPAAKHRINDEIVRLINNTGRRQSIRVHSWNIRNPRIVNALIRAHKRGVSVRVIIWVGNARSHSNPDRHNPNPLFNTLAQELRVNGNKKRKKARKSGTTRCVGSCRGPKGLPHSKYYLFSGVNGVRNIVMYGGHNATEIAGSHQWNDVDVFTGHEGIYNDFLRIFNQSFRDRPARPPWVHTRHGRFEPQFYPHQGRGATGDPVIKDIRAVQCNGSLVPGTNGRTQIRIAMTSWHGPRGINIARALVQKQNQGCNVKIVYAVAGNEVMRVLRQEGRQPVPFRQITQDFDGDGVYDRYLHTKVMVVRGAWNGNRRANMVWNGSANWAPAAMISDEAGMRMDAPKRARRYARYVDRLYANPPPQARANPRLMAATVGRGVDPYSKIEVN